MGKVRTRASAEPLRWGDLESASEIARRPGPEGNDFDVRMSQEADGVKAAKKIVAALKERGVCLVEANAPAEILTAACEEAQLMLEDGEFKPPLQVQSRTSMLEAEAWQRALSDEESVVWLRPSAPDAEQNPALRLLAKNISDFAGGLGGSGLAELGLDSDRFSHAMVSCYTGDRRYSLHIDNAHSSEPDSGEFPDNGMRVTLMYFINTCWDPHEDNNARGGLDVFLTDPTGPPESAAAARSAPRLRIAPHADTLVIFPSERVAHQVIETSGPTKWFCMTVWTMMGAAMQELPRRLLELRRRQAAADDDEDGSD